MANYSVEVTHSAAKQLKKVPKQDQLRLLRAIADLADAPFPPGSRKLTGYADTLRIRVGMYRVIYSVDAQKIMVLVLKVGHRKEVYR